MANIAQMVNVLQAMILTDKAKMVLTPTYHLFRMYVPFQDSTFLPVSVDAGTYTNGSITLPRVDAIAARDKAGVLWLAITNVDPTRPVDVSARFAGATLSDRCRGDADGRSRGQREQLRGPADGRAQAGLGEGPGRPGDRDTRAEVGDGAGDSVIGPVGRPPTGEPWRGLAAVRGGGGDACPTSVAQASRERWRRPLACDPGQGARKIKIAAPLDNFERALARGAA